MATDQQQVDHPLAAAQPWLRRLYDEAGSGTTYGYAVYYLPRVVETDGLKTVQKFHDFYIDRAISLVRSGSSTPGIPRFRLQPMLWPVSSASDDDIVSGVTSRADGLTLQPAQEPIHFIEEIHRQVSTRSGNTNIYTFNTAPLDLIDADDALVSNFQQLREHFRNFRLRPRPAYRLEVGKIKPEDYNGLIAGLLDNVFIVVNENSAYTWWDRMPCDRAWVWAVDPEFEDDKSTSPPGNGLNEVYRGYLRVRLQQLANWFYEARRFRPEVTLRDLWDAARQSTQYAFVSLDPELYHVQSTNSDTGSALRPAHLRQVREVIDNGVIVSRWMV